MTHPITEKDPNILALTPPPQNRRFSKGESSRAMFRDMIGRCVFHLTINPQETLTNIYRRWLTLNDRAREEREDARER